MPQDENLNIENLYLQYLNKMGMQQDTMHPVQKQQLKDAFYGGVGQTLVAIINMNGATEEDYETQFADLMGQVGNYFEQYK